MASPGMAEREHCVQLRDALQGSSWSQNNRLLVDGQSVTLTVFGVIDDCLWHTARHSPVVLRLHVQFLRKSDQGALAQIFRLATAQGTFQNHVRRTLPSYVISQSRQHLG